MEDCRGVTQEEINTLDARIVSLSSSRCKSDGQNHKYFKTWAQESDICEDDQEVEVNVETV